MSTQIENQLRARIEAFAGDITAILQRAVADSVSQAMSVKLGGKGGSAALQGRNAKGPAVGGEALLREVKRKGGRRMEELAVAMRTSTRMLKGPMKQLLATKKIKTTGQARGTKYHAA